MSQARQSSCKLFISCKLAIAPVKPMQKHDAIDSDEDKLRLVFSQDKLALDACCLDLQKLWSSAQSVA